MLLAAYGGAGVAAVTAYGVEIAHPRRRRRADVKRAGKLLGKHCETRRMVAEERGGGVLSVIVEGGGGSASTCTSPLLFHSTPRAPPAPLSVPPAKIIICGRKMSRRSTDGRNGCCTFGLGPTISTGDVPGLLPRSSTHSLLEKEILYLLHYFEYYSITITTCSWRANSQVDAFPAVAFFHFRRSQSPRPIRTFVPVGSSS